MIEMIYADGKAEYEALKKLRDRAAQAGAEIAAGALTIMEAVRTRGYEAVCEYSVKFDGAQPYEISRQQMKDAFDRCDPELLAAMRVSAENIRDYQSRLMKTSSQWETSGGTLGQVVRALSCVGLYVPGGTAAYPSTVLMNAIPAKVAGVEELIMVTPPTKNLNTAVLAAAWLAGVDRVIAVGGVQAVAALTYGAGYIPKVDKLVGPGNAYVAAAKRLAFGMVDIDMVAGPSEILVIADSSAPARYVAADLLSQAEHDTLSSSVLVTTSAQLADEVRKELEKQTERLERAQIIRRSLADYGAIILCDSLEKAAEIANIVSPEHLEIMTENPRQVLPLIKNAGAVFLGQYSPEPLGDYMAGPSHVLPTSGTARFFSPLSSESFLKRMSTVEYTREGLEALHAGIDCMARSEGLTAHANSVNVRFRDEL